MTTRRKILWLPSWYPNRSDPFDGDFIQRHARAAAIHHDIHVLFVAAVDDESDSTPQWNRYTGLTEQILYIRKGKGRLGRLLKQWHWRRQYLQAIKRYIREQGPPDIVHVHVAWKAGLMALYLKAKYGIPFFVSEHWGIYDPQVEDHLGRRPSYMRRAVQQVVQGAAAVISVSNYLSQCLARATGRGAGLVIPNVVDTSLFYPGDTRYERFSFVHVSNMVPLKNVGLIIEAFRRQEAGAQLILIGNRDDRYVQMAADAGILNASVFFMGEIAYREVAETLRRSHCLVTYSDTETFSCVTAEALCAGLPVIAAMTSALPELVGPREGLLVEPRSVDKLAAAMREMRAHYGRYRAGEIAAAAAARYGYGPVGAAFGQLYSASDGNSTRT